MLEMNSTIACLCFVQSSDNNEERNDIADDTENFDGENIVSGEQEELPKIQKYNNLDEVLDESNYADLPVQPDLSFSYTDRLTLL